MAIFEYLSVMLHNSAFLGGLWLALLTAVGGGVVLLLRKASDLVSRCVLWLAPHVSACPCITHFIVALSCVCLRCALPDNMALVVASCVRVSVCPCVRVSVCPCVRVSVRVLCLLTIRQVLHCASLCRQHRRRL